MLVKFFYFCIFLFTFLGILSFFNLIKVKNIFSKIKFFLKSLFFFFLSLTLLWIVLNLRNYNLFSKEKLIAEIICRKIKDDFMELSLKMLDEPQKEKIFILKGDQWMIGGEILRWNKIFNLMGLSSFYKLTRINSRYLHTEKESFATHFELNGGVDKFWLLLNRYQKYIPFIEAVYGNCVYSFPKEKILFKLYVTPTGYSLKEEILP